MGDFATRISSAVKRVHFAAERVKHVDAVRRGLIPDWTEVQQKPAKAAPSAVLEIFLQELQPTRPHSPLSLQDCCGSAAQSHLLHWD